MCFAALSFVASAVGAFAQHQAGVAKASAQNEAWSRNQIAALAAQRDTQQSLTLRQMQESGATNQALRVSLIDEERRRANAIVSGVHSGMAGVSVDNLVADIGRRAEENRVTLLTNWESTAAQLQRSKEASEATYEQRVNSMQAGGDGPSVFGTLAKIAGAGLTFGADLDKAGAFS